MKLYIRWGNLSNFRQLYERDDFLQTVLENETGIRWEFDSEHKYEIEKLLKGIKYEIR